MHCIDVHSAGPIPGTININLNRPALRRNGRETSANGTRPEDPCKRQGDAYSTACCGHDGAGEQGAQFFALIHALARDAARADHETGLAKPPASRHPRK